MLWDMETCEGTGERTVRSAQSVGVAKGSGGRSVGGGAVGGGGGSGVVRRMPRSGGGGVAALLVSRAFPNNSTPARGGGSMDSLRDKKNAPGPIDIDSWRWIRGPGEGTK